MNELRKNKKNPELFWNIIFYMSNYGLPYDFILPYLDLKDIDRNESLYETTNSSSIIKFGPEINKLMLNNGR
jgi:hypothetical protein